MSSLLKAPKLAHRAGCGSRSSGKLARLTLLAVLLTSAFGQDAEGSQPKTITEEVFDPDVGQMVKKTIVVDPLLKAARIDDIEPDAGPTFGDTRVIVKGGPFTQQIQDQYPKPMVSLLTLQCKFGHDDMIVPGTYILCKAERFEIEQTEARHKDKNDVCIACDNSPPSAKAETISFTVSLTGDFSDTQNSLPYRYYPNPTVHAIYPRYGPKDGKTIVQVWGEGFLNFDRDTRCSFGSKTVIATFVNSNYMICESPFSDVVQKPISFTVLLNKQQNSKGNIDFWYYSWPSVVQLIPNAGPDQGGTEVWVKGNNFNPFKDMGINNHNDTFMMFEGLGKVPCEVFNSTRVRVYSPPSYILRKSIVEITLNNQQYTDDNVPFFYYRPPNLFDAKPREGPVQGGTKVIALGSNFRDTGNITCRFDDTVVKGEYISETEIHCVSPPHDKPETVPFAVSLERGMYSPPMNFLYYDKPVVYSIGPTCGPDYGYTQIAVQGKNFVDMGHNKAYCVFNQTIFTNATIFSNELLYCDSPPFMDKFGHSMIKEGNEFYVVEVTIDGGNTLNGPFQKFMYYRDPDINVITPPRGPLKGGTVVRVDGKGFNQEGACNKVVRFGTMEMRPMNETEDAVLYIVAPGGDPLVLWPDQTVVSVALNGQQFAKDRILHIRDDENTYEYYEDPIISSFGPKKGSSKGGTPIKVNGIGFMPNRNKEGEPDPNKNKVWVKFVDPSSGSEIAPATQVNPDELTDDTLVWRTPPSNGAQTALMMISLNDQDWIPVPESGEDHSYTYFDPPHITKLTPSFGPVKDKHNRTMDIEGVNFFCPKESCKKTLTVRFGEPPNQQILVRGEWVSESLVRCKVPRYTKPDVLRVELTLNGEDYTNDGKTYGYFDPYVLDAQPRLISVDGSTKVKIKGLGFVNSGTTQAKFDGTKGHLVQGGSSDAIQSATFIDKGTLETSTFPQSALSYQRNGENVWWDSMTIEASVYEGDFTENGIELWYIQDPVYGAPNKDESPANVENQLFIPTDFKNTDPKLLEKYGNLTCRFLAEDGTVKYTKAKMVTYPLDSSKDAKPNTIQCATPKWDLHGKPSQKTKLDIALNGVDFRGNFDFTFVEMLLIHRTVPMSGPVQGNTKTRVIGSGFKPTKSNVDLKWGVLTTNVIRKEEVTEYVYYKQQFENMIEGSEEVKAYIYEASDFRRVDTTLYEESSYHSIYLQTPQLSWWNRTQGGPYYVEVGADIKIEVSSSMKGVTLVGSSGAENSTVISSETVQANETAVSVKKEVSGKKEQNFWNYYEYDPSNVEFYYYKDCITKEVGPHSALAAGGTPVSVIGAWYKYMPEYGVVPHCRFGNKIVRAQFDSTVRIVCIAPPQPQYEEDSDTSFWVSLNGVDFIDTGIKFSYYEQPVITGIWPDSGPEAGGTQVYITGTNFTNMSDPVAFNCKFTPFNLKTPPKTMPAIFFNSTTVGCATPGGWGQGDIMHLQLTLNGADYDDYNNTFTFYSISRAFPRSGPSDGTGGDIIVEGYGFRNDTTPLCMLNGTVYLAREVQWNYIKCPMPPAEAGPDYFGNVNLKVSPNGGTRDEDWHNFSGGFQYYPQPVVEDIFPKQGPNEGVGVVNFYGEGFRADYPLAQLGCRIGQRVGKAVYVSSRQIRCVIETLDLIEEGESSPAQVALNSYSWSKVLPSTQFYPYGISNLYPNSGPNTGVTDVIVEGKGFQYVSHLTAADLSDEELDYQTRLSENDVLQEQLSNDNANARCRFGTPANYAIVDAQILSYERLVCRAPQDFTLKEGQRFPLDVPFSIAFSNDEYDPWTDTSHKFRFYDQPIITRSDPVEVEVGTISEVLVFADENTEFFDPVMINKPVTVGEEGNAPLSVGGVGGIMCRFGRFGETQGIFINETLVKCVTPAVEDDPDSIYRETVRLTVAMNGQDHDEETSQADFTFIGTGTYLVFWPFIIGALLLGLMVVALVVCCSALFTKLSLQNPNDPHTVALGEGIAVPKGRADWSKDRSSVDMLERASGQQFYLRDQFRR